MVGHVGLGVRGACAKSLVLSLTLLTVAGRGPTPHRGSARTAMASGAGWRAGEWDAPGRRGDWPRKILFNLHRCCVCLRCYRTLYPPMTRTARRPAAARAPLTDDRSRCQNTQQQTWHVARGTRGARDCNLPHAVSARGGQGSWEHMLWRRYRRRYRTDGHRAPAPGSVHSARLSGTG